MKIRIFFSFIVISIVLFSTLSSIPEVNAGPNRNYSTFMAAFKGLANAYPTLVTYETVGKTVENNDIIMFKIGNPAGGKVLFDGAIHGFESIGGELLYSYAQWLLTSDDPLAKQILAREYTLLIPAVNVDNYNIARANAHGVDLNRNFATGWQNSGSANATSENYHGPSPLSEPESQTMVKVFETFKPKFYVNLHSGGGAYYLGSTYGNKSYYASIVNNINSMSKARGVTPYPYYWTDGAGFAISDAARMGITSFLLELTVNSTIPLSTIKTTVLQRFIPIAAVLSQEGESKFEDGFESGSFNAWTGTYVTPGETATVAKTLPNEGSYSAKFVSNGTGGYEAAYCYASVPTSSRLYASGYFYVSQSGIAQNDDRFYFIGFSAGGNDVAYAGWRRTGGVDRWTLVIRNATGWATTYSSFSPSLNEWHSVELYWAEGAAVGHAELYVDGTLACSLQNQNTTAFGGIDQVRFGLAILYSSGPTTVYADSCRILGTPPWDINQDGTVNIPDLAILANAYGSAPGSSNWNPAADINADEKVGIRDLAMLARHYGEQYT